MHDPRYIVDDIRVQLAMIAEGGVHPDGDGEVADLAVAYAEMCREVNRRLRRCKEYLATGLRSEAVHEALCPPDVRQTVETLTLAERSDWVRYCAGQRLPVPQPLFVELLPPLTEAIAIEQKLEPLLARNRVLALAREPLTQRLAVLRLLAEHDANALSWVTQIRELEELRLRQMRKEAKVAFRSRNQADIEQLYDEITQTRWECNVPADLSNHLSRAADVLQLEGSLGKLRLLADKLAQAVTTQDYAAAQSGLTRWQELVSLRQAAVPIELLTKVRAATAWLSAEERRREINQRRTTLQPILKAQEKAARPPLSSRLLRNAVIGIALAALVAGGVFAYLQRSQRKSANGIDTSKTGGLHGPANAAHINNSKKLP